MCVVEDIQEEFFKLYGIPKVENYRQYNYAQVPRGLEELQKSIDAGIECKWINRTPTPFNNCVYWTELHNPKITDERLLDLLFLVSRQDEFILYASDREKCTFTVLKFLIDNYSENLKTKVQDIF